MARLARAFKTAGYEVTVLTSRQLPNVELETYGIRNLICNKARGVLRSLLFRRFYLNRLVQRLGGDALLSFNYYSRVSIFQATYHINVIPFLSFSQRLSAVGFLRAVAQNRLALSALRNSTLNIFESDHILALAFKKEQKIRNPAVAYIGVELSSPYGRLDRCRDDGAFVTVTSGAKHKRNDITVEFFRRLIARDSSARLDIVGDRDAILAGLSNKDRSFVEKCQSVRFTGYIGRDELFALLSSARALVTFSELESFFMVGVEAMAAGCPVIGADNSSIRESLGSVGLLVPPGDIESAVDQAIYLSSMSDQNRLEIDCKMWAYRFDASRCAKDFVDIFERGVRKIKDDVKL